MLGKLIYFFGIGSFFCEMGGSIVFILRVVLRIKCDNILKVFRKFLMLYIKFDKCEFCFFGKDGLEWAGELIVYCGSVWTLFYAEGKFWF